MHPVENLSDSAPSSGTGNGDMQYNGIYHGAVNGYTQQRRKPKRLVLVRHGETEYNAQKRVQGRHIDAELNDNGKHQAELLAERLKEEKFDFVAASSLKRAYQTADAVIQLHNNNAVGDSKLKIHTYDSLQEMNFGIYEGKCFDKNSATLPDSAYGDLEVIMRKWTEGNLSCPWPNGESPLHVESRARTAIQNILQLKDDNGNPIEGAPETAETFLIVCHGRLLKILLCSLMDIGLEKMEKFAQNNTAVNVLEYDEKTKSYTAILFNCTAHLDKAPNN